MLSIKQNYFNENTIDGWKETYHYKLRRMQEINKWEHAAHKINNK
jgi:hypothetical protein